MREIAELAVKLHAGLSLDEMLTVVLDGATRVLGCPRVSLRLLDATRTRLLVTARAGGSFHRHGDVTFRVGEGLVGWVAREARSLRVGDATIDPRFVRRDDQAFEIRSFVGVPLVEAGQCIGVLSAASPDPEVFTPQDEESLVLLAALCTPRLEVARLARLAHVDPLTGALNRRGLEETMVGGLGPPLSIALADVDHFKQVNDRYGHSAGDEVLRAVTAVLAGGLRVGDAVVRWGGEEFLLVHPGAARTSASGIAERARAALERSVIAAEGQAISVTASFGVATLRPGEVWPEIVDRADRALYRAKLGGRNRVVADD